MEKELAIQCVPVEMMQRLKALAARLWDGNNPASVHLNAILEEFDPDIRTLGAIVKEYETDYTQRLASMERERAQKEGRLKEEAADYGAQLSSLEKEHAHDIKKIEELKAALLARDEALAELKSKLAEEESALNGKYATKMQELYDKVNRKEMEMLTRWEEKNSSVEVKLQTLESDFEARAKQFKLKEKALDADFNGKKAELLRTFDKIRAEFEVKEKALAEREAKKTMNGKSPYTEDL